MSRTPSGTASSGAAWRVVLTAAVVAAGAATIGAGTYALFSNTQSATATFATGTVNLAAIGTSGANNRLSIGASNLAAGDTIWRAVDIQYTGTISAGGVTLTTTASPSSVLDTDATYGLQMQIDKCSVAWTETTSPYNYSCSGTTTNVLASQRVISANMTISPLTLTTNTDNYLVVKLSLPSNAPDTEQGKSSTIQFSFTATQRASAPQ
jgi:spore coat-associated protein N